MYGQYENYTDIGERFKEFYTRIRYLEREGKIWIYRSKNKIIEKNMKNDMSYKVIEDIEHNCQ